MNSANQSAAETSYALTPARSPMVAVVNATPASVGPASAGLSQGYPESRVWTLLDDRLVSDAEAAGGLTPSLTQRMLVLIDYAVAGGADAILLACSMYGPVVELARTRHTGTPMLSSDEALFSRIIEDDVRSILLLGPLPRAVQDSTTRLRAALDAAGSQTQIRARAVSGAPAATKNGDMHALEQLLIAEAQPYLGHVDAIVLGNFSIAPAQAAVAAATGLPVLSPTLLAANALREQVNTIAETHVETRKDTNSANRRTRTS